MTDDGRKAACERVAGQYPEMAGVRPTSCADGDRRVFTFQKRVPVEPGGPIMRITVRVTVDASGRVTKVVASKG